MKVLVVGAGGREHALAWKLAQSPRVSELYVAPGNPGSAEIAEPVPIPVDEIQRLADFAAELAIDLTVVGPELPLTLGLADEFAARGLAVFGPRRGAALLEGSKIFAKEFMVRHAIPTAPFAVAHDREEARRAAARFGFPVVLKADGLAAGKGVLIPRDDAELNAALAAFYELRRFGASGERLVVEQHLDGEELSFIALCDGQRLLPLATSKDYKRLLDGDAGPNTGGMGAHSPSGLHDAELAAAVVETILLPAVRGLAAENRTFVGFLYAGLILTAEGPRVLEFNARLGDPEAQPLLLRLEDDLAELLAEGAHGRFNRERLHFRREAAACLVLASAGYPDEPVRGEEITGVERAAAHDRVVVFHGATERRDGRLLAAGGRVLDVCATGADLREALRRSYLAAAEVHWPSRHLRGDIGRRVVESAIP